METGEDLYDVHSRKGLNLVAFYLIDKSEGEYRQKLTDLLSGRITYTEFSGWVNSQKPADEQGQPGENIPQQAFDELEELRALQNGDSSIG